MELQTRPADLPISFFHSYLVHLDKVMPTFNGQQSSLFGIVIVVDIANYCEEGVRVGCLHASTSCSYLDDLARLQVSLDDFAKKRPVS